MPENGDIIALIPTYNEIGHIAQVVTEAQKYVPIVVVDDGSTDGSGAAAALAGAKVLIHARNQGKGAALNTGFDYAAERHLSAVITLDADGQHDPAEIPDFIAAFRQGKADIIIGQRSFEQIPGIRRWGNRTGTRLLQWAMGQPVPDNQSGYRLFNLKVLQTPSVRPRTRRFEAEVEILLRAQLAGFRIAWIPIKTIYGDEVSYYNPVRDSLLFLRMIWRIRWARRHGSFD